MLRTCCPNGTRNKNQHSNTCVIFSVSQLSHFFSVPQLISPCLGLHCSVVLPVPVSRLLLSVVLLVPVSRLLSSVVLPVLVSRPYLPANFDCSVNIQWTHKFWSGFYLYPTSGQRLVFVFSKRATDKTSNLTAQGRKQARCILDLKRGDAFHIITSPPAQRHCQKTFRGRVE